MSTSLSFPAYPTSRPPKRHLSPPVDLTFFTPAADSFNPKPYVHPSSASSNILNSSKLTPPRNHVSAAQHIPLMDPSLSDSNAVFIHPPFNIFPDAHLYPEGLSYSLMAANPEWFLDPNDFISSVSTNPSAISYPPQLEPPRGWCPAKKKDLKALGADGWPEGGEPRLRCTFCRRTYAGVNAKSMWRRHVYEKHKIAMSNRRDGNDRIRNGRGSNRDQHRNAVSDKENVSSDLRKVNKTSTGQPNNHKSKARPFLVPAGSTVKDGDKDDMEENARVSASLVHQQDSCQPLRPSRCNTPADTAVEASIPEPVPLGSPESDRMASSPHTVPITLPMSPYDPTLTPSFRHSPPRLPSDQPWRFPSPSHPLHSRARELCLGMLVRGGVSPVIKPSASDSSSPSLGTPSIIRTPSSAIGHSKPFNDAFGSSPIIFRPSPRQLFPDGQSPFPSFNAPDLRKRVNDSPLSGGLKRRTHCRKPSAMNASLDLHGDWLSDASLSSTSTSTKETESSARPMNEDPFGGSYKPLSRPRTCEVDQRTPSPCRSSSEAESPVIRNARHSGGAPELEAGLVGLGIGLMAPFRLSTCRTQYNHGTGDSPMENDEEEVERVLADGSPGSPTLSSRQLRPPPLKRRRMSAE